MKKITLALALLIAPIFAPLPAAIQPVQPAEAQSACANIAYDLLDLVGRQKVHRRIPACASHGRNQLLKEQV
jgi:hypothetical protein